MVEYVPRYFPELMAPLADRLTAAGDCAEAYALLDREAITRVVDAVLAAPDRAIPDGVKEPHFLERADRVNRKALERLFHTAKFLEQARAALLATRTGARLLAKYRPDLWSQLLTDEESVIAYPQVAQAALQADPTRAQSLWAWSEQHGDAGALIENEVIRSRLLQTLEHPARLAVLERVRSIVRDCREDRGPHLQGFPGSGIVGDPKVLSVLPPALLRQVLENRSARDTLLASDRAFGFLTDSLPTELLVDLIERSVTDADSRLLLNAKLRQYIVEHLPKRAAELQLIYAPDLQFDVRDRPPKGYESPGSPLCFSSGEGPRNSIQLRDPDIVAALAKNRPATLWAIALIAAEDGEIGALWQPHVLLALPAPVLQMALERCSEDLAPWLAARIDALLAEGLPVGLAKAPVSPARFFSSAQLTTWAAAAKWGDARVAQLRQQQQLRAEQGARARRFQLWQKGDSDDSRAMVRGWIADQLEAARRGNPSIYVRRVSCLMNRLAIQYDGAPAPLKAMRCEFKRGLARLGRDSGVVLDSPVRLSIEPYGRAALAALQGVEAVSETPHVGEPSSPAVDVAALVELARLYPALSLEELRRNLATSRPHMTRQYAKSLGNRGLDEAFWQLARPVERAGDEPNLILAAHIASTMLGAGTGATYGDVCREIERHCPHVLSPRVTFDIEDLEALQRAYPMIPVWESETKSQSDLDLRDAPTEVQELLVATRRIAAGSPLLATAAKYRPDDSVLANTVMVSVDLPLADNLSYLRHVIFHKGARGADITMVWKSYPNDPLVPELARRCYGVRGTQVASDELDRATRQAIEQGLTKASATGQLLAVHLVGTKLWGWFAERLRQYPEVQAVAVSHTTSDADELRAAPIKSSQLSLVVMADSDAKIEHERAMFSQSFTGLLGQLEAALEGQAPLRSMPAVVFGGAGRLIGPAALNALDAWGLDATVIDPKLSRPEGADAVAAVRAAGVGVVDAGQQLDLFDLLNRPSLLINATAESVLSADMLDMLKGSAVYMNLGTGQQDVALVRDRAVASRRVGSLNTLPIVAYDVQQTRGSTVTIFMVGDGQVANHNSITPNPSSKSDVNNLIKLEAFELAQHRRAKYGAAAGTAQVQSLAVAMTREGREVVVMGPLGSEIPGSVEDRIKRLEKLPRILREEPVVLSHVDEAGVLEAHAVTYSQATVSISLPE